MASPSDDDSRPHSPRVAPGGFTGSSADKSAESNAAAGVTMAIFIAIVGAVLFATAPQITAFLGMDHVVAAKSHGDFMSFYTNSYVVEHGVQENRYLHIAGTSIVIVLLLLHPGAILAMGAALSLGFGVFPLTRSLDNGLVEGAIVVGTFVFLAWRITGKAYVPFLVMLFGYGFAWAGHFFIEGNRPATFIYPSYSLASDFFMVYQTAMGAWAGN